VDIDAFVAAHAGEWARLETLVRRAGRPGRLDGAEVDELVRLYQRTATHLSVVQSRSPDPALVGRLSTLVASARAAVVGGHAPAWREVSRFLTRTFPAAVYRNAAWWVPTAAVALLVSYAIGAWVATHPDVQRALAPAEDVRRLVSSDFARYYRENPAGSFAARVWTNNAWVAAGTLTGGLLLGIPTVIVLLMNSANIGVVGGYMAAAGKAHVFFGLVLPHGMLELTAVFIAAGTGLRLGWTVVDPGHRRRGEALAQEGRAAMSIALGLVLVLAVSGAIEAFVTPSPLPTWARIAVGGLAEAAFLGYVVGFGRRAVRAGETGDVAEQLRGDVAPSVG
jgi:uncharacterized membrane protein SpoIIM required for sporulation